MVNSGSLNLISHSNPFDGAFTSASDGFQKYQRGVSLSIPFSVLDDSLVIFPTDSLGIIRDGGRNTRHSLKIRYTGSVKPVSAVDFFKMEKGA